MLTADISVRGPCINSRATVNPERAPLTPQLFSQPLKKCAEYTAENVNLLGKAILLFQFAMQPVPKPRWENAGSGIVWGFDVLFRLAAPGIGVIFAAKGLPGTIGGAAATAAVGTGLCR